MNKIEKNILIITFIMFIIGMSMLRLNDPAITTIYNVDEVIAKIKDSPKGTVIFIDVDDTLITPKSNSFRTGNEEVNLIDQIKNNQNIYSNYEEIISNWRLARKVILVDQAWPEAINELKKDYKVFALTKMNTGKFGNIESMEEWRYRELKSLNIEFSKIPELENKPYHDDSPSYYQGIFMSGSALKSQAIDQFLSILKPFHIILIDDKIDFLKDVSKFCQERKILFTGILYRGVDRIPGMLDRETRDIQFEYLVKKARWLEDDQVHKKRQ